MKIVVLSGKGGTGKTTISTNLAVNIKNAVLIDTDVEEPNSHVFLNPKIEDTIPVTKDYPDVDMDKCILCGKCGDFCRYNAILPARNKVLIFKEMCHDCGGCELVCPAHAIKYIKREIGNIYSGVSKYGVKMKYGDLNVGEVSGVKIIEELKELVKDEEMVIIDAPPGTSCSTVAAATGVDYAIVVSEPTPFGVSDMKMVVEMLRNMNIPFGVVVNKAGLGDNEIYEYCDEENIEILQEVPFDKEIAKLYASGNILSYELKVYKEKIETILKKIK
ncbi:ATP-binding protein [Maledivibacter halophilus]|uniref:MinD superfamily P-loop ATPase, contains an inserted ferredoxin domain n=1 Tax=Maledivibacter halophilus TaxID=36842 RepID=A0A1T5LM23_9FIRM|nr:ATP-binding protein [Maledivibacter halophilus]SKC77001.1 MinD superfamily P-loop ATPase, contains an inserted ferredoxin domain [Maledivibacter halophilus]